MTYITTYFRQSSKLSYLKQERHQFFNHIGTMNTKQYNFIYISIIIPSRNLVSLSRLDLQTFSSTIIRNNIEQISDLFIFSLFSQEPLL